MIYHCPHHDDDDGEDDDGEDTIDLGRLDAAHNVTASHE